MALSFSIETIDQSDRWYFVPGSPTEFELRVCNRSNSPQPCTFSIEEPIDGGSVDPPSAILEPNDPIVLRLKLTASWSTRNAHVVVAVRDLGGMILATIVRPIATATVSDCTVSLGWKEAIVAGGSLRGFILQCFIRNIGKLTGAFQPRFTSHPALQFPAIAPSILMSGEAIAIDVPVIWNRAMRDDEGFNHPRALEVDVPAGGGRRSASTPWETVQLHLRRFLNDQDTEVLVPLRSPPNRMPVAAPEPASSVPEDAAETNFGPTAASAAAAPKASAMFARAELQPAKRRLALGHQIMPIAFAFIGVLAIVIVALQLLHVRLPGMAPNSAVPPAVATPAIGTNGAPGVKLQARTSIANAKALLQRVTSNSGSPESTKNASTPAANQVAPPEAQTQAPVATAAAPVAKTPVVKRAALPQRAPPVNRELVVTLSGITAWYGHGGHVVHVTWDSTAQAAADVQLLDDRNVIVAERHFTGAATSTTVSLPPRFHGPVFVAVTAIGYHGERVVQSGSPQ